MLKYASTTLASHTLTTASVDRQLDYDHAIICLEHVSDISKVRIKWTGSGVTSEIY